jgi:signal transduction histidine kinase
MGEAIRPSGSGQASSVTLRGAGVPVVRFPAWPLRRTLAVLMAVMVAVFAAAGVATTLGVRDMIGRVDRTTTHLTALAAVSDRLLSTMITQEAGLQGYAREGDQSFRTQVMAARTAFVAAADSAEQLPGLDARSRELIREQRAIADRWFREVAQPTFVAKDALREAVVRALVLRGRQLIDEFRQINADLKGHLEALERAQIADLQRTAGTGGALIVAAIAAAGLIGLAAVLALRHAALAPLARVMAAVAGVRAGRLDTRVSPSGAREFRALGAAFNDMVAAMEAAERERARLEQLKTDFIAVVSHELRTPLTAIKGYTELVLDGDAGELGDEQREYLTVALANTDRLVDLVDDLLDLSRIASGRFEIERAPVDPAAVVDEAVTAVRPLVEAKDQRLVVEVAPDLPPVAGDRRRLTQVALNLLSNAHKYTPAGGTITVSLTREDGELSLVVRDTGAGIRPEDLPHLFERFFRADDAARNAPGTGLGLAITRSLVELHGGRITVQSALGVGSRFEVRLPAAAADVGVAGARPSGAEPAHPAAVGSQPSPEATA